MKVTNDNALLSVHRLATGSGDSTIKIISMTGLGSEAASFEELAELRGHDGPIHALAWLPTQGWLLSGSSDRSVRTWRLRPAVDEEDGASFDERGSVIPTGSGAVVADGMVATRGRAPSSSSDPARLSRTTSSGSARLALDVKTILTPPCISHY
jgi:WD40 repeat protein